MSNSMPSASPNPIQAAHPVGAALVTIHGWPPMVMVRDRQRAAAPTQRRREHERSRAWPRAGAVTSSVRRSGGRFDGGVSVARDDADRAVGLEDREPHVLDARRGRAPDRRTHLLGLDALLAHGLLEQPAVADEQSRLALDRPAQRSSTARPAP